jgi:hypothetical protein
MPVQHACRPGAKVEEATLDGRPLPGRVNVELAPGQSAEFAVRYLTSKGAATKVVAPLGMLIVSAGCYGEPP